MDCNLPGSSVHEILQARVPEWVASAFSMYVDMKRIIMRTWLTQLWRLRSPITWPLQSGNPGNPMVQASNLKAGKFESPKKS